MEEEVVAEVRRLRDEHAARFGYDLDAIYADLKRGEDARGLPLVRLVPRRLVKRASPRTSSTPRSRRRT